MPKVQKKNSAKESSEKKPPETVSPSFSSKQYILLAVQVVLSGLAWFLIRSSFASINIFFWSGAVFTFLLSLAWLITWMTLTHERHSILMALLLSVLWIPLFIGLTPSVFLAMIVYCCAGIYTLFILQSEVKKYTRLKIWQVTRIGLHLTVIILALAISSAYFGFLETREGTTGDSTLVGVQKTTTHAIGQLLTWQVPGYQPDMTLDQLIQNLAHQAAEKVVQQTVESNFSMYVNTNTNSNAAELTWKDIPEEQKEAILQQAQTEAEKNMTEQFTKQRDEILKKYEIEAHGSDTVGSVIEQLIGKLVRNTLGGYLPLIKYVMASSLFLVLAAFSPLFRLLIRLGSIIIFKLLILVKIAKKTTEQRDVETVSIQ